MKLLKWKIKRKLIIFSFGLLLSTTSFFGQTPNSPEAASFEPVDATDMVDLLTGDMSYVIPLLNVPSPEGGYPVVLSYHSGIGYEQESSWVGLGWNINPGAINRYVNGYPDDWDAAEIRSSEYFEYKSESVSASVGFANSIFDVSVGYSWDSNKSSSGSVSVGVGINKTPFKVSVGVGYSTEDGIYGSVGVGMKKNGFGIGLNADTRGFISGNLGYSTKSSGSGGENFGSVAPGIGISFSSRRGATSVNASLGSANLSSSKSGSSSTDSFGVSARFYLYGAYIGVGYNQTVFKTRKLEKDYVYGPLYYKDLADDNESHINGAPFYGNGVANEHSRDMFMDSYEQKIPKTIYEFVEFEDIFNKQKGNIVLPAYDNYMVNAQGLSGVLNPSLLQNGFIISEGYEVEYSEVNNNPGYVWDCEGVGLEGVFTGANGIGSNITRKTFFMNSHFNPETSFDKGFSEIYFYFNNLYPQDVTVDSQSLQVNNNVYDLNDYLVGSQSSITTRQENSNFTQVYTNQEIINGDVEFLEAKGYDRLNDVGFVPEGIGGYKVTAIDGKTYYYSRPVYAFEQINRELYPKEEGVFHTEQFYKETRRFKPYATHWLLTAITGPDFIKNSNFNYPSKGDYGYWVRFDYGTWTDGYVWRNPSNHDYNRIPVNESLIAAQYSWGRKQLVYLDKIVTRSHAALFVKSVREDNGGYTTINYPSHEADKDYNVYYPSQPPLKLDEIILIKNDETSSNISTNTQIRPIISDPDSNHTVHWTTNADITYKINQQSKIIDNGDFEIDESTGKYKIYEKADKVIKFNQDYSLAKGTTSSSSTQKGRLTLNSMKTLGRKGVDIIPPYKFYYIGQDEPYIPCFTVSECVKDDWGYHSSIPEVWSMNKIKTPSGGEIEVLYEKDEYYTEAFSRNYWTDGLTFQITPFNASKYKIRIQNSPNQDSEYWVNFNDYFAINESVALDLWLCKRLNYQDGSEWNPFLGQFNPPNCNRHGTAFNLIANNVPDELQPVVLDVDSDYLELTIDKQINGFNLLYKPNSGWNDGDFISNFEFWKHDNCPASNIYEQSDRGTIPIFVNCPSPHGSYSSVHNMTYSLVANKVPGNGTGGGIRVKEIKSIDENLNEYSTLYNYDNPKSNITSGITSYAPSKSLKKFVAYQSQIPSPRVTYEYITLTEKSNDNTLLGSTQYKYNVLKPVVNVFNPNMTAGNYFRATVDEILLDQTKLTNGVNVKIEDNISMIGTLSEVIKFNLEGQNMQKVENNYLNLDELASPYTEKSGTLTESFHNLKSVYEYEINLLKGEASVGFYNWTDECFINDSFVLKNRHLNTTTKVKYPLNLTSKKVIEGNLSTLTEFSGIDSKTGSYLTTKTQLADNTWVKSDIVPAYTKYPQMGSKVDNINNKHMLTQEAMNITSWSSYGNIYGWETLNAGITTWKDSWLYRDHTGNETIESGVWRKQKTFVWKDAVDPEKGTYQTTVDYNNDYFDWNNNEPTSSRWKNISETTRYTHWSKSIEIKDINDNHTSSKMAELDSKIVANGNARFTEMFYSGAEYNIDGIYLDQEIKGVQFRDSTMAHTGKYSLKVNTVGDKAFETKLKNDEHGTNTYKISVWVNCYISLLSSLHVDINGTSKPFNGETIVAGEWTQLNHYENLDSSEQNISIIVYNNNNPLLERIPADIHLDDFRIHPVQTSMNSYVYDEETDELTYILGPNNMATKYVYDKAGRLCRTYNEIETNLPETSGGFKITNQYKYHYKNQETLDNCYCCEDGEEIIVYPPLHIKSLKQDNKGEYVRVFQADAQGGSGNYTYQWRWLTDYETNTYSNFVDSIDKFDIPFAAEMCDYKTGTYNKMWKVEVKVTDSQTGESVTKIETVKIGDCKFVFNDIKWADIEISTNYNPCNSLTNYTLRPFIIKPEHNNYSYLSRTYNHITEEWSNYINVNNDKNNFCGDIFFAPSVECKYSYSLYQTIQYRIIDNITGDVYNSYVHDIYLDCIETPVGNLVVPDTPDHIKYNKFGNVVKKNENGEIIDVYNIKDKQ